MTDVGPGATALLSARTLPASAYARMAAILRYGLLVSLGLLASSLAVFVARDPTADSAGELSSNPVLGFLSWDGLMAGLGQGSPEAFLTLGILVLVATPVLRVVAGCYYFGKGKERTLTMITLTVLGLLLVGLLVVGPLAR